MIEPLIQSSSTSFTVPKAFPIIGQGADPLLSKALKKVALVGGIVPVIRDVDEKSPWEPLCLVLIGSEIDGIFLFDTLLVVPVFDGGERFSLDRLELVNQLCRKPSLSYFHSLLIL